jgi:hypothetical protein
MATSNKSKKILEKARKIAAKTKKKKVSKVDVKKKTTSYPEGQNAPQSKKYTQESDKALSAKSTGWRWTKEGAKKLGKSVESKPTTSDIEKYRNETFKLKGKPNKSGPKGVGDGSHRYLYVERRADKADITRKNKLAKGGIMNRHIWEGWTVENFIDELSIEFNYHPKFKSRDEVKKWAMENQPYYKKYIPEVVDYYWEKNQREKYEDGGEMAKGGKANENEYIVSVEIENEYGKIIEFGVNVFANTEDEAMDKAEANIRENDSRYEDSSIDIVGVKLVKNKMAKGGSVEEKYEVELFFKGLSGENRKIGKYVVSQNTLDNLEDEWSHILSIDVIDESEKGSISWYNLKKEIYAKGKEKGLFADGGMMAKGGKIPSSEVADFKKYVKGFYGKDEIWSEFFPPVGVSNEEVNLAVSQYIEYCKTKDDQWGGGDSFDREIVRDIMFYNRGTRKGLEYQRAIKEIFAKDKKEYGGILQPMIGGVNADPRFDIYNTTMFAKRGAELPKGYFEYVSWDEVQSDPSDNNKGYIYGINLIDEDSGEILDVEWFKSEDEREKAIKKYNLVEYDYPSDDDDYAEGGTVKPRVVPIYLYELTYSKHGKKGTFVSKVEAKSEDDAINKWVDQTNRSEGVYTIIDVVKSSRNRMEDGGEMAHGGSTHEQGYDDREDESLAMRHGKIASKDFVGSHKRREHSRRDDAQFEERHKKAYGGLTDSSIELLD